MDLTPALHNREIQLETRYCLWRDERNQPRGYLVFSRDVTWERRLEAKMRKLAVKLVTLQDDERRQIARELHDSLGQLLTAAKIDAELVGRSATVGGAERQCLSEAIEILDRSLLEVRTLSFLLHPPTLQNTGFASAVGTYVEGFSKRSGIRVDLNLPNQLRPLPKDVEFVLFRVLQESLTNIHRHSGSKTARIALECTPRRLTFRISDSGRGIPSEKLHEVAKTGRGEGIGLMGMRERLEEFGGQLRLHSDRKGVMLTVSVPLRRGAAAA
jgi:two-component system NarL family sensor kinase